MLKTLCIILAVFTLPLLAQSQSFKITIIDKETGNGIPYTVLQILPKEKGNFLVSDEKGELTIDKQLYNKNDSLQFSSLGYLGKTFQWDEITKNKGVIKLDVNPEVLNEVVVTGNMVELGNLAKKTNYGVMMFSGNMVLLGIENPDIKGKLSKIKYYQHNFSGKALYLRLRVFKIDKQQPEFIGDDMLKNEVIIIKPKKKKGWVEYDIKELNIPFDGGVFVGVQMLPESYYNHKETTFSKIPGKKDYKKLIVTIGSTKEKAPGDMAYIISEHNGKEYFYGRGYPLIRIVVDKTQ